MSDSEMRKTLYMLCLTQLLEQQNYLKRRAAKRYFNRIEVDAYMKFNQGIFEMAAGAAVTNKMRKSSIDTLVNVIQDIEDILQWNMDNSNIWTTPRGNNQDAEQMQ